MSETPKSAPDLSPNLSPNLSNERLVTYLDGSLVAEDRAALEAALAKDKAAREQLELLRDGDRAFRDSFDDLLSAAPADRLQDLLAKAEAMAAHRRGTPANDSGGRKWVQPAALAASLLLAVAVGYLAGRTSGGGDGSRVAAQESQEGWTPASEPSKHAAWRQAVADYQVLYTRETLAGLGADRGQQDAGLARVGTQLGLELAPNAVMAPELDYKRAQILEFGDQPLAQLAYLHEDEIPVAFCITRLDQVDQAPRAERLQGLNVVHWIKDGFAFMVIGDAPEDLLDKIGRGLAERVG